MTLEHELTQTRQNGDVFIRCAKCGHGTVFPHCPGPEELKLLSDARAAHKAWEEAEKRLSIFLAGLGK